MPTISARVRVASRTPLAAAIAAAGVASPAHAAITATSPGINTYAPTSLSYPMVAQTAGTLQAVAWNEQMNVSYTGPLDFAPAMGNSLTAPTSIPAVGPVQTDSHYVYFDHFSHQGWGSTWIDFSNPILGVLFTDQTLAATNPTHGISGATGWNTGTMPAPPQASLGTFGYFNTWGGHEGWVWMSSSQPNRLYIELPVTAASIPIWPQDTVEMRILTAVPAPGSAALLALSSALAARRRRHRVS